MKEPYRRRAPSLIGNDGVKGFYWDIVPGACNAAGQNLTKPLAGAPRSIPLRRIAEVEDVVNLCACLASPLAHSVNGTMIEGDRGRQKPLIDAARA